MSWKLSEPSPAWGGVVFVASMLDLKCTSFHGVGRINCGSLGVSIAELQLRRSAQVLAQRGSAG